MKVCFVHPCFPGQFTQLARHFVDQGHDVVAFHRGIVDGRSSSPIDGLRLVAFGTEPPAASDEESPVDRMTRLLGDAANLAMRADELKRAGWRPDIVYSHTGWGSAAFLHDVFPKAKYVTFCEWYYNNDARSTDFLIPGGRTLPQRMGTSSLNLPILAGLAHGDVLVSPTEWQKSQFPPAVRDRIEVAPDGIDLDFFSPDAAATVVLPNGKTVGRKDRIVTYATRGADPFRGFSQFIEALGRLQARDPRIEAIILGDRKVYYGSGAGTENHFHEVMAKAGIAPDRTHFLGRLGYEDYRNVLRASSAHVYLTVPFVLSWSFLEAMATGCAIVGSDTAPVREFMTDGENGLLANFFDTAEIADRISEMLDAGSRTETMRVNARGTIRRRWSADIAMGRHGQIVGRLLGQPK